MPLANVAVSVHATEVQPRKQSMQDMAGGTEIGVIRTVPVAMEDKLNGNASSISSLDPDEPTEEDRHTLRHVSDKLPWSAFLVAVIELCERFAYYGLSGTFQNYIQNSYHDPKGLPGAIGRARYFLKNLEAKYQNKLQSSDGKGPLDVIWCFVCNGDQMRRCKVNFIDTHQLHLCFTERSSAVRYHFAAEGPPDFSASEMLRFLIVPLPITAVLISE